jgi:hypothetical protein
MDSAIEHNQALQENGLFTAADLEDNKRGEFSPSQLKKFEADREFMQYQSKKYSGGKLLVSLVFGVGLIGFTAVLYFVGVFDILQSILGGLFLPAMCGAFILALLVIFIVIPRQYQASVDAAKSMGTPLAHSPLGKIQVIETRAEAYESQRGQPAQGGRSSKITNILQMDGIKFIITSSLREVIQSKRLYRAYAVQDQGVWVLLSMETLE